VIPEGVSLTLVEPQYPVNLGHVARLVKNFGVSRLNLVNPKVDMSVAAVYAAHASDVLESARKVSLARLRRENDLLVATTAVRASRPSNVIRRTVGPERLGRIVRAARRTSLVFGRDTTGLTNEEIALCDVTIVIDTGAGFRTLNVSHAAAIILYLVSRGSERSKALQSRAARSLFADGFYRLALAARMPPHRVKNLREVGKRIAASTGLTDAQLNLMAGVFRRATLSAGLRPAPRRHRLHA
jgi:TrmH family RNA methyltransferase